MQFLFDVTLVSPGWCPKLKSTQELLMSAALGGLPCLGEAAGSSWRGGSEVSAAGLFLVLPWLLPLAFFSF